MPAIDKSFSFSFSPFVSTLSIKSSTNNDLNSSCLIPVISFIKKRPPRSFIDPCHSTRSLTFSIMSAGISYFRNISLTNVAPHSGCWGLKSLLFI